MPTIYDNVKLNLVEGLRRALGISYKADFCVGYFNLRGWRKVSDLVDEWAGGENNQCRLLVGMQKKESELYKNLYKDEEEEQIDLKKAKLLRKELAREFRDQLTLGYPTNIDEQGLRRLVNQLRAGKLVVKLFLRYRLHAKLYLTFRHNAEYKEVGYLGSSNLTLSGLSGQGELNVDIPDKIPASLQILTCI